MSNNCYEFSRMRKRPAEIAGHFIKDTYEFIFKSTNSNHKYIVEATYHQENFFAVKFFCFAHRYSSKKYNIQTYTNEPYAIVRTCLSVFPILIEKFPNASFVAIGARSITPENLLEPADNTIRYRFYYRALYNEFYQHPNYQVYNVNENSSIALLNIEGLSDDEIDGKIKSIKNVVISCYDNIHFPD